MPGRRTARSLVKSIGHAVASAFVAWYRAESRLIGADRAFESVSQALSLLPDRPGVAIRQSFFGRVLPRCGATSRISFGTRLTKKNAEIGEHVFIGADCDLGWVIIEDDVLIGSGVQVLSGRHQHRFDDPALPIRLQGGRFSPIRVGQDTWIGSGAIVMADVGRHAVVAAGAVVVSPVEDGTIVAGNPAVPVGRRPAARV